MNVYLISGLGADSRAFNNLVFEDHHTIYHLSWIKPLKQEMLNAYAKRLAERIDNTRPFTLIGLSFGGMLASEMGKFLKPEKIILLSSVNNFNELPFWYKLGGSLRLHKLLPSKPIKGSMFFMNYLFGINRDTDKKLLKDVIENTDPAFSKWAMDGIVNWRKTDVDTGVIRIHGDKDRILPITGFKPDHLVKNGGHLMVINKADEVSALINRIIKS